MYKTIDEDGHVIFTDIKPKGPVSEKVELKPVTPIESMPARNSVPVFKAPKRSGESGYYSGFEIIEPSDQATVRNKQRFSVRVSVQPEMLAGHKIRLLLDGEIVETKKSQLFTLEDVDRGTHTITAQLLDARGKVIRSGSNIVYVHRTVISQ